MELKFKVDTKLRKQWFTDISFSHPAKMSLPLQLWIISKYTKEGEVILDPMAGSGTLLVSCSMGRNVICVDLEDKFVKIMEGNWEKIQQRGPQLGYKMGWAKILQGDARNLEGILADKCIFSPPYGELANEKKNTKSNVSREERLRRAGHNPKEFMGGIARNASIEDGLRYSHNEDNIGNLPYGDIDKIITSPPYAESLTRKSDRNKLNPLNTLKGTTRGRGYNSFGNPTYKDYVPSEHNLGNLPYGNIDAVITSPPYEASVSDNKEGPGAGGNEAKYGRWEKGTAKKTSYTQSGEPCKVDSIITSPPYDEGTGHGRGKSTELQETKGLHLHGAGSYSNSKENIGELKGQSYLQAMLQVYSQCHQVLRPEGLMILVTKDFIRNRKRVDLARDTIKLCEQAGFTLLERHYRRLPAQSFWRVIYYQKNPNVEKIDTEDILIFEKNH